MRCRLLFIVLLAGLDSLGGGLDEAFLIGKTDKARPFYARGEKMVFTLELKGAKEIPSDRYYIDWERTGDDGKSEKGVVQLPLKGPWTYTTSLDRPGFVRLSAFVKDRQSREKDGRFRKPIDDWQGKYVFFDGSAAVEPETLQGLPEPADFDEFWAKRKARLAEVPMSADLKLVPEVSNDKVRIYAATVTCAGPRPVTGYLAIPTDTSRKYPARVEYDCYSHNSVQKPPRRWGSEFVRFWINAHGYELEREQRYYDEFYASIKSAGRNYAYDKAQNDNPETIYFGWMAYRVMRSLDYVKSRPEWDGKRIEVSGMSQGGMQSLWAAALDPQVTYADVTVPWGCDWGGAEKLGRTRGGFDYLDWTPTLEYFDCVHFAKRIPRTTYVTMSRVGLGDYVVPPSGIQSAYNNMRCRKRLVWFQGGVHCWTPPDPVKVEINEEAEPETPGSGEKVANCRATPSMAERIAAKCEVKARDVWHGYDRTVFAFDGEEAWVVEPKAVKTGKPWCWTMEWPGVFATRTGSVALLGAGYHYVTLRPGEYQNGKFVSKPGNMTDRRLTKSRAFQRFLVEELGFAPKANLIGMSWGGFYSVRYAATHPDAVNRIYLDAPLLDFSSRTGWDLKGVYATYGISDASYCGTGDPQQPVNMAEPIAKAGISVLLLYGGKDAVVPPTRNCERFIEKFKKAGGRIEVVRRGEYAHHPHGLDVDEQDRFVMFFGK